MEENKPIKIIVEDNGRKLELEIPWDNGLDDWQQVFRTILKWLQFTDSNVNELFNSDEFGEVLPEEDKNN